VGRNASFGAGEGPLGEVPLLPFLFPYAMRASPMATVSDTEPVRPLRKARDPTRTTDTQESSRPTLASGRRPSTRWPAREEAHDRGLAPSAVTGGARTNGLPWPRLGDTRAQRAGTNLPRR